MSIGYVAGLEKARKAEKPVVKEVKTTKKTTKKAVKEENFD